MLPVELWSDFLADRGIDLTAATVTRLDGGEVNLNWKISAAGGDTWVVRQYRVTRDPDELDCELAAVAQLWASAFPTPAPLHGSDGRLWDWVDGQPAAVFKFAVGRHPSQRPGGYGSLDLRLGESAARLAGRMHNALSGHPLPGQRSARREPAHQIAGFLAGPMVDRPLFADLLDPLTALHARLGPIYASRSVDVPAGFIHNDITPSNLLLDNAGDVTALLDFDDSAQTYLIYELGAIVGAFGNDQDRCFNLERAASLISAYDSTRPLTSDEVSLLPDFLAAHAAAQGISVLSNWLSAGRQIVDPRESFSIGEFLDILRQPT